MCLFIYYPLPCWSCQQGPLPNGVHQRQPQKQGGEGVRQVAHAGWNDWEACVSKGGVLRGEKGLPKGDLKDTLGCFAMGW